MCRSTENSTQKHYLPLKPHLSHILAIVSRSSPPSLAHHTHHSLSRIHRILVCIATLHPIMATTAMQFQPFQSAVEVGFWSALGKHKLEVVKLSEESIAITGSFRLHHTHHSHHTTPASTPDQHDTPAHSSPSLYEEIPARFTLTAHSFDANGSNATTSTSSSPITTTAVVSVPGALYNTNTIESFKELDKKALFNSVVAQVRVVHGMRSTRTSECTRCNVGM
jgi:hypothetical protein